MKTWIIGLLLIQGAWAKPVEFPSRIVSYRLCFSCLTCTGLLLDEKTILTAAHCAKNERPGNKSGNRYEIKISQYVLKKWFDPVLVQSRSFTLHRNPQYNSKKQYNDVMIIKLKKNLVKLPTDSFPPQFVASDDLEGMFWAKGFGGEQREAREMPLDLRASSPKRARLIFNHVNEYRTCFGDSGGPTYIQRPGEEPKLVSIMSGFGPKKGSEETEICSPPTL